MNAGVLVADSSPPNSAVAPSTKSATLPATSAGGEALICASRAVAASASGPASLSNWSSSARYDVQKSPPAGVVSGAVVGARASATVGIASVVAASTGLATNLQCFTWAPLPRLEYREL